MEIRKKTSAGDETHGAIPRYYLYGEDSGQGSWFANVEPLGKRCREANWYIAPHSHPNFTQIILVRSGRGVMVADDREAVFESPCALVVPTHMVHSLKYDIDTDGWVLTISEAYLRNMLTRAPEFEAIWKGLSIVPLGDFPAISNNLNEALLQLDTELDQTAPGAAIAVEAYLATFLVNILRRTGDTHTPDASPRGHGAIVKQFKDLIEKRYREGWPLARFAKELNVTVSALRTACANVTGDTPIKLIHDRIIVEAKRNLIYTDMTVSQIAYWLGFEDPSYFSRFFTKQCGERPAAFRTKRHVMQSH